MVQRRPSIVLATANPGKIEEIRVVLGGLVSDLHTTVEYPDGPTVPEEAPTLEGNAAVKALAWRAHTGLPALADDTGLEVEALGGAPGVRSARYAGENGNAAANRDKLVRELKGETNRSARFRTVVAYVDDTSEMFFFEGVCNGRITEEPRGSGGFGYDPLFVPAGTDRTFAELTLDEKNAISHRGAALQKFAAFIKSQYAKTS